MLPKEQRLRKESDISKVYRYGRRFFTPHFSITFRKSLTKKTRIAVSVSKTVSKKAVDRNLLKRRVMEAFAKEIVHISLPYDVVVSVKKKTDPALPFAIIAKEAKAIVHKLPKGATKK